MLSKILMWLKGIKGTREESVEKQEPDTMDSKILALCDHGFSEDGYDWRTHIWDNRYKFEAFCDILNDIKEECGGSSIYNDTLPFIKRYLSKEYTQAETALIDNTVDVLTGYGSFHNLLHEALKRAEIKAQYAYKCTKRTHEVVTGDCILYNSYVYTATCDAAFKDGNWEFEVREGAPYSRLCSSFVPSVTIVERVNKDGE